MKVAIFIEPWIKQQAGISVFTENLVRSAAHSKHEWMTIGSQDMGVGLEHLMIPSWKTSFLNPLRWIGVLKQDLSKYNIDVLIDSGHYSSEGMFFGAKRVAIVHDITPALFPFYHRFKTRFAHKVLIRKWLAGSAKIVAISEQTKLDVSEVYGFKENLVKIYPGIQDFEEATALRMDISDRQPYILAVGTIEPRKNQGALIKAFDSFCESNKTHDLVFAGGKGWKVNLPKLISESQNSHRIKVLGFVPKSELKLLYEQAEMSIYVSLYEGFGFPILEAMKLSCPVITSNVASMKEIAERAAFLVDPHSETEIAMAMLRLITDQRLRRGLIQKGKKRADQFSWKQFVKKLDKEVDLVR